MKFLILVLLLGCSCTAKDIGGKRRFAINGGPHGLHAECLKMNIYTYGFVLDDCVTGEDRHFDRIYNPTNVTESNIP